MITFYGMLDINTNTIFYVGQTKNLKSRIAMHKHRYKTKDHCKKLYDYIEKIGGFEKIKFIVLETSEETERDLILEIEDRLIEKYKTYELGNTAKNSEINKGELNHFYGKKHSKETRDKISKNHADMKGANSSISHKVVAYKLNGDLVGEYDSIREAGRQLGLQPIKISEIVRGIRKSTKGYTFKRL